MKTNPGIPLNRRTFVLHTAVAAGTVGAASFMSLAHAQAKPLLAETDPQAVALGYKADTTKVDKAKYPKHDKTQICGNCALYQAKVTDPVGGCPLFAGKNVANKAWCNAWVKKA